MAGGWNQKFTVGVSDAEASWAFANLRMNMPPAFAIFRKHDADPFVPCCNEFTFAIGDATNQVIVPVGEIVLHFPSFKNPFPFFAIFGNRNDACFNFARITANPADGNEDVFNGLRRYEAEGSKRGEEKEVQWFHN